MMRKTLLITVTAILLLLAGQVPASARTAPSSPRSLDPILAAPLLGPRAQLSTESIPTPGYDNLEPAAAYNSRHDEYLVVWQRSIDYTTSAIYGRRTDSRGIPIGSGMVLLTTGSGYRTFPSIAYNAVDDQYFLVYSYCSPCGSPLSYSVYGRILNYDLSGGSEFEIWGWAGKSLEFPQVAWSSLHNEYLVVWHAYDIKAMVFTDVAGRRYASNGTAKQDYVVQYRSVNEPRRIALTYHPQSDEYLVTWEELGADATFDIYAARVKWDNTIERTAFPVLVAATAQLCPSVTVSQNTRYLVAWTQYSTVSGFDIYSRELDVHGDPVGDLIPIDTTTEDTWCPVASARPGSSIDTWVVWMTTPVSTAFTVAGRHWTDPSNRILWTIDSGDGPIAFEDPTIATGFTGVLFAYTGRPKDTEQYAQVYSRLWTADIGYLPLTLN